MHAHIHTRKGTEMGLKGRKEEWKIKNGDDQYVETYVSHDCIYVVTVSDIWVR